MPNDPAVCGKGAAAPPAVIDDRRLAPRRRPKVGDADRQVDVCPRIKGRGIRREHLGVERPDDPDEHRGQHGLGLRVVGDAIGIVERHGEPVQACGLGHRDLEVDAVLLEVARNGFHDVADLFRLDQEHLVRRSSGLGDLLLRVG